MVIVTALRILVSFHDQKILFMITCWSLLIKRWFSFTENCKTERRISKLLNCTLLIILSIYAYYNSKQLIVMTWITLPWILSFDLFFTLYEFSSPFIRTSKIDKKIFS
jgi:hypothetical protein